MRPACAAGVAVALLIVVAGCRPGVRVDCGPLPPIACQQRVDEIFAVVLENFPESRVTAIEILNVEGHANVILDDGSEVGFGERL